MTTLTHTNVRIRSYAASILGAVECGWYVRPSQADQTMPRIWSELEELRRCEPGRDWTLEVRGDDSDWHEYR